TCATWASHWYSAFILTSPRMLPSVIGEPRQRVQVRWRTFFGFSRLAQCSHLCARGIVSVLIRHSIHHGTASALAGAGHQLGQLLFRVRDLCIVLEMVEQSRKSYLPGSE
ncbi:MAG: hypothetical protein WBL84_03650, partial [Xanthobacteraceae bacterium]